MSLGFTLGLSLTNRGSSAAPDPPEPPASPAVTFGADLLTWLRDVVPNGGDPTLADQYTDAVNGAHSLICQAPQALVATTPSGAGAIMSRAAAGDTISIGTFVGPGSAPTAILLAWDFYLPSGYDNGEADFTIDDSGPGSTQMYLNVSRWGGAEAIAFQANDGGTNLWQLDCAPAISDGWHRLRALIAPTSGASKIYLDNVDTGATFTQQAGAYYIPDLSSAAYNRTTLDVYSDEAPAEGIKYASMVIAAKTSGSFTAGQIAALDAFHASLLVAP